MPQPLIYHIDVNSAFLSWEAAELLRQDPDAPDIRSFPSVIGGSEKTRHGIVLAKSPSAAALGVCTGEPLAQARRKCPDLKIYAPHYSIYVERSRQFMALLKEYAPSVDTYSIDEADKVMDIIEQARTFGLLDGQDVIFNPSVEFYWDSDIRCYCDETILAICWKEKINDRVCSFVEVKLADGSQIRRKLVNDTFGSNEKAVASELSRSANAVIAMNADYYKYRDLGVCVYQGQLCRYETSCDVLFIDSNGDFRMLSASELGSREDVEQYIADNNIQFSMSFGPILVRDGELQQLTGSYAGGIGEMYEQYSRSGIGQYDKLHYLIATVNHSQDGTPRATVNQFAEIIYGKGVQNAYNFDGGQTSEGLINNERYNYVDWDNEREVSDILYFATAIPEQEVG